MQDRQKPFSKFQQTAAIETYDKFRYKSFLKPCLYSINMIYVQWIFFQTRGSLFFCMTGRKSSALQVPYLVPYKALGNFSKALYGTTRGTCSARFFRPVMVARVIKNTRRKPFEFKWPKCVLTENKQALVTYNKLLTNLASSSRAGKYWPSVRRFMYGPRCARSVLPRPRASIPQYGPRARLVRS